eukprot:1160743-Pelagomonas_calceolata.AAC.4
MLAQTNRTAYPLHRATAEILSLTPFQQCIFTISGLHEREAAYASDKYNLLHANMQLQGNCSKQLKARPGRQAWEQAPDFMKLTATRDEAITALRCSPFAQRMEAAHELREQGSKLARDADQGDILQAAIQQYTRALSIFLWFDRGQDNAAEDIALVDNIALLTDEQQAEQAKQICAVLLNNIATCLLRIERTHDAIFAARHLPSFSSHMDAKGAPDETSLLPKVPTLDKALELVPYNARALYRRAVSSHNLGTSEGLEAAVKDLQAAVSYEPGNAQVVCCFPAAAVAFGACWPILSFFGGSGALAGTDLLLCSAFGTHTISPAAAFGAFCRPLLPVLLHPQCIVLG